MRDEKLRRCKGHLARSTRPVIEPDRAGTSGESSRRSHEETQGIVWKTPLALIAIGTASHGVLHTHAPGWRILFAISIARAVSGWFLSSGARWPGTRSPRSTASDGLTF